MRAPAPTTGASAGWRAGRGRSVREDRRRARARERRAAQAPTWGRGRPRAASTDVPARAALTRTGRARARGSRSRPPPPPPPTRAIATAAPSAGGLLAICRGYFNAGRAGASSGSALPEPEDDLHLDDHGIRHTRRGGREGRRAQHGRDRRLVERGIARRTRDDGAEHVALGAERDAHGGLSGAKVTEGTLRVEERALHLCDDLLHVLVGRQLTLTWQRLGRTPVTRVRRRGQAVQEERCEQRGAQAPGLTGTPNADGPRRATPPAEAGCRVCRSSSSSEMRPCCS